MPYPLTDSYLLTEIPMAVRRRLAVLANERGVSVSQLVRVMLSEHYGLEWSPGYGRRRTRGLPAKHMLIRAEPALFDAIRRDARKGATTMRQVILDILAEQLDVGSYEGSR